MKKQMMMGMIAILLCGMNALAGDGWYVVGSAGSSVMVAPATKPFAADISLWTATTYAQGDYIKLASGAVYWTPTGGVSTTEPSHSAVDGTTSYDTAAIWWKRLDRNQRTELVIYADVDAAGPAYVTVGNAVRMSGDRLDALRSARVFADEQRAVYIKGEGTFHVSERK